MLLREASLLLILVPLLLGLLLLLYILASLLLLPRVLLPLLLLFLLFLGFLRPLLFLLFFILPQLVLLLLLPLGIGRYAHSHQPRRADQSHHHYPVQDTNFHAMPPY